MVWQQFKCFQCGQPQASHNVLTIKSRGAHKKCAVRLVVQRNHSTLFLTLRTWILAPMLDSRTHYSMQPTWSQVLATWQHQFAAHGCLCSLPESASVCLFGESHVKIMTKTMDQCNDAQNYGITLLWIFWFLMMLCLPKWMPKSFLYIESCPAPGHEEAPWGPKAGLLAVRTPRRCSSETCWRRGLWCWFSS